ncbi:hypothetical protein TNCV_2946251 [Trichonephila clavipes]|nr:hypothetical protein TNCV_2946251 [Trichonephila clavipes]
MTVSRIWNRWVQDGITERRAESQRPPITSSRENKHVTRVNLMDRSITSRALSQELESFAKQVNPGSVCSIKTEPAHPSLWQRAFAIIIVVH